MKEYASIVGLPKVSANEIDREKDPKLQEIVVFRVRHGESAYHEHTGGRHALPDDDPDLTEEGIRDVENAAEAIIGHIHPESDIVVLLHSPRRRAESAASIIGQKLKERYGKDVVYELPAEQKHHETQTRVTSFEIVDESGEVVPIDAPRYPDLFNTQLEGLAAVAAEEDIPTGGYIASHGFKGFENYADVIKRTRNQLTYLVRIARTIQPKIAKQYGKRLVIVETEHNESLDDLAEQASNGEYTLKKGTGIDPGEVVAITIPVVGNSLKINFPSRSDMTETTLEYDPTRRKFPNKS